MASNRTSYLAADGLSQARGLSSSITSLSSSPSTRHPSSSHISKTYRQASTLFLTRRLPEALSTVLPLVTPPQSPNDDNDDRASNASGSTATVTPTEPAPVIRASRSSRVKVWSLYLTVLNAITELEPDDGKDAFGGQEWRALCYKVRSGDIWEEVIRNGYHGVEGDVDAEVVINLATLLLAHSKTQALNQKRLENYLAAARTPNLDISADRFSESPRRYASPGKQQTPRRPAPSGADTPRDLAARVKLLELYTLHVLPRNNEWEYAREFIHVSPVLDEERREAFLQALDTLHDEQAEAERREEEERAQREEAIRRDIEEARRLRAENEAREKKRLEEERVRRETAERNTKKEKEKQKSTASSSSASSLSSPTEGDFGLEKTPPTTPVLKKTTRTGSSSSSVRSKRPLPRQGGTGNSSSSAVVAPPTLISRATTVLGNLSKLVDEVARAFQTNPYVLLRMLAFVIGLLLLVSRKKVRERLAKIIGVSWNKIKATAGMGAKVSYI